MGAPRGVLPGTAPIELVLARNARAAVAVTKFGACPEGFDFDLVVLAADREEELDPMVMGYMRRPGRRGGTQEEMLRFGMQFADGSKVTNLSGPRFGAPGGGERPPGPVLQGNGGGGGGGEWHHRYWVWPLPPPGPLAFVCEWPAAGIELTRVEIDAQPLIDAAGRAQEFFERDGRISAGPGLIRVTLPDA
jgi:hypothetical protein